MKQASKLCERESSLCCFCFSGLLIVVPHLQAVDLVDLQDQKPTHVYDELNPQGEQEGE